MFVYNRNFLVCFGVLLAVEPKALPVLGKGTMIHSQLRKKYLKVFFPLLIFC